MQVVALTYNNALQVTENESLENYEYSCEKASKKLQFVFRASG